MQGQMIGINSGDPGGNGLGGISVEVGESLGKPFRVVGDDAAGPGGKGQGSGTTRDPGLHWHTSLDERPEGEKLRHLLPPLNGCLAAADSDLQTVAHTGRRLGYPKTAACAISQTQQGPGKVIDLSAGDNGTPFGTNLGDLKTGDKT